MRAKKEVRALCHEPIAVDRRYRQPWADVWIRFKDRRRLVCKGPTLMGVSELDGDIALTRACMVSAPELMETWETDLASDLAIRERLRTEPVVITDAEKGCPNVYTAEDDFDRSGAERMLLALVRTLGVKSAVRFHWPRPDIFVTPVSLRAPAQEEK